MTLFMISWFAFSYSFPLTVNFGVRHTIASRLADAERAINEPGVYMARVSVIRNGRIKPLKSSQHLEE